MTCEQYWQMAETVATVLWFFVVACGLFSVGVIVGRRTK